MTSRKILQVSAAILAGILLVAGCIGTMNLPLPTILSRAWGIVNTSLTARFMQMLGIPIWAEHYTLHSDLYSYSLHEDNGTLYIILAVVFVTIAIALWRKYPLKSTILLLLATSATALFSNSIRITMLIQLSPSPPDPNAFAAALQESQAILATVLALAIVLLMVIWESVRFLRRQRMAPIPGTESGAVSEIPPFWHRVLRRYRHAYLILSALAVLAAILYAGRPERRNRILSNLVDDMTAQSRYELALRLGQQLAAQKPENINVQLRLTRIRTLANQSREALDDLDELAAIAPSEYIDQINLLYAYNHTRNGEIPLAQQALQRLQSVPRRDPIWNVIFTELALAMNHQNNLLANIPDAARALNQLHRLLPAIPAVAASGRWDLFLTATAWIAPQDAPDPLRFHQIMAELERGNLASAAAMTRLALQTDPGNPDFLAPLLILVRSNSTAWEPLFANAIIEISRAHNDPDTLFTTVSAAFSADRPDLAWTAFRKLQLASPDTLHTALAQAAFAGQWFRIRNHALQLPANDPSDTTDLRPFVTLGKHLPLFQNTVQHIPLAEQIITPPQNAGEEHARIRMEAIRQCQQSPKILLSSPALHLQYAAILEASGDSEAADKEYTALAKEHPNLAPLATHNRVRLMQEDGNHWQAHLTLRPLLSSTDQHASQLPLFTQWIDALWNTRQYLSATYAARDAVRRFPEDPTIRTILADILLQQGNPEQALHILEHTTIRRSPATDALEADALRQTQRYAALQTFNRQRLRSPTPLPANRTPAERLPPAEFLLIPISPDEYPQPMPVPESPLFALVEATRSTPTPSPDFDAWLQTASTPLEQAEAMYTLASLMIQQGNTLAAQHAIRLAVAANPQDPALWLLLLRIDPDAAQTNIAQARTLCPADPDLWLADLVLTAHRAQPSDSNLILILDEATPPGIFPVETLVRAADFLWRGTLHNEASKLMEMYRGHERGLLPALLLTLEAAEANQDRSLVLQQIEAAIEAAGAAAPELYARFIKSKLRTGQIEFDGNVVNALRELRQAEPGNTFWPELLGYVRFMRGGSDMLEAGLDMQAAIRAGSTNRTAFLIAAEGFRKLNRPADAANTLRQGLQIHPGDIILLNNLAYILAENPSTAAEAMQIITPIQHLAQDDQEINDTLAFVLIRNNQLDQARELLAKAIRSASPDSRVWFRSHLHLAEIVWRQGRTQMAASMLEQLLNGARNIPDEDVLNANRLLVQIRTAPAPSR